MFALIGSLHSRPVCYKYSREGLGTRMGSLNPRAFQAFLYNLVPRAFPQKMGGGKALGTRLFSIVEMTENRLKKAKAVVSRITNALIG